MSRTLVSTQEDGPATAVRPPSLRSRATRLWERVPPRLRLPVAVYAACQLVLLGWWAAFFPGLMSYDSIAYVWQVTTDHWLGNHSVLYNALVWLSIQICGDLWLLTLVQTVAYAAAFAYTCVALRDLGVRGRWSAPAAVALAVLPATGSLAVFVWKDSAFTASALLAFAASLRLIARRLKGRQAVRDRGFYRELALLEAGLLGIALFRNNSILVVLLAFPFLVFALQRMRRWITALTAATTVVYLLLQFLVYPAVGIVMPRTDQVYAFNYADIAVAYGKDPSSFTAADLAVMKKVAPLSHWRGNGANCWDVDDTMQAPFDRAAASANNDQLLTIWTEVLKRTPQLVAYGHLCRSQIAWGIFPGPGALHGNTMIAQPVVPANLFGWADWNKQIKHSPYRSELRIRPLSDTLHKAASWWYYLSETPQLQWLLWRGAFWCYLAYGVVALWIRRRRQWAAIGLAAFTAGLQLSVIAANPAPLARYVLPVVYLGVFSLTLLPALRTPRRGGEEPEA
ncbi:hypothetical protein [Streptacidiphilus monticola]|uniref:Glycosyltransferase RgtA/B/C/D-like domain-containing protein n=1 Tax=Streptacidiphilus monticola TaxID=2161674 RepID=A0ABW1GAQ3_9ACTN